MLFARSVLVALKRITQKPKLGKKVATLLKESRARQEKCLEDYFKAKLNEGIITVHRECRKRYTDLRKVETTALPKVKRSRSSAGQFNLKRDCVLWRTLHHTIFKQASWETKYLSSGSSRIPRSHLENYNRP